MIMINNLIHMLKTKINYIISVILGKLELFLSSIYNSKLPVSGLKFHVSWADSVFTGDTPNNLYLASIPENRNLTEYYIGFIKIHIELFQSAIQIRLRKKNPITS